MKVVIFCGGFGVRMGEATQTIPKPMITIGTQPILFHIMKWYATWGHTEFILCLGYRGEEIKRWFINHDEALANDFVLDGNTRSVEVLKRDMAGWRITFVDTGLVSPIGERLRLVTEHLGDDEMFLATYGDGLTDVPLDEMIDQVSQRGKTASFLSVKPRLSYHVVDSDEDGVVGKVQAMEDANIWLNAGFFVFNRAILDVIREGEDLVNEPFLRLIDREELLAFRYEGFWAPMDTIKDKQQLDALVEGGLAPWQLNAGTLAGELPRS